MTCLDIPLGEVLPGQIIHFFGCYRVLAITQLEKPYIVEATLAYVFSESTASVMQFFSKHTTVTVENPTPAQQQRYTKTSPVFRTKQFGVSTKRERSWK